MPDTIYHVDEQQLYKPQKEHFYVYLLCNPLKSDQPFYCGKGQGRRAYGHLWAKDGSREATYNPHKHRTIKNIRRAELEPNLYCLWEGESEEQAFYLEKFFIALFGRKLDGGSLCNLTKGGEGPSGYIASDETRAKMSAARTGTKKTPEHRAKISAAHIGKEKTPEHRAKMSAANIGKKLTPEHRAKMSAAHARRKMTQEHRAKMKLAKYSKLWLVTFPDGHQERIKNLAEFARQNDLRPTTLNNGYTSKGFKAKRVQAD